MASDRPLHVCLISDEYPPDTGWGGIGTYTYNMALGLASQGHRVSVIAGCVGEASAEKDRGVDLHRIGFAPPSSPTRRVLHSALKAATRGMPYLRRKVEFARAAAGMFGQIHGQSPVDVAEAAEYDANGFFVARRFRKVPLVVKIHTPLLLNTELNGLPVTREVRWCDRMERSQCRRAAILTSPSRKMAERAGPWIGRGKSVRVVPNPIDTVEFSPEGPAPSSGTPYLFYTGRLERRKGVHILLEAFRSVSEAHPGIKLVLAGHDTPTFHVGGSPSTFERYVSANGLLEGMDGKVEFLGKVDRRDLPPLYRGSLACVFPSEQFENFPYSCLEAMACGRPPVVTDSGGMAEMAVDGESGLVATAGCPESLARALARIVSDKDLADRMGKAARARVESRYSMEIMAERTTEIYMEAIRA